MGKNHYESNPCNKCRMKVCYDNCGIKKKWLEGKQNGVFPHGRTLMWWLTQELKDDA